MCMVGKFLSVIKYIDYYPDNLSRKRRLSAVRTSEKQYDIKSDLRFTDTNEPDAVL